MKEAGPYGSIRDGSFQNDAISQIKQFLFSGHETSGSALCYVLYLLSKDKKVLRRLRQEHDDFFGIDRKQRIRRLSESPSLLNQLPYTTAVCKEMFRLFPFGSSLRAGEPGYFVQSGDGRRSFPTEDCMVWAVSQPLHRDPNHFPDPDAFIPKRFLSEEKEVETSRPLVPGAWRPFELGPRNCIGQELAMLELKTAMVLVVQHFDIEVSYERWDREKGLKNSIVRTLNGERAYQNQFAGPSDGLPCLVSHVE